MLQITLKTANQPPVAIHRDLKSPAAAKLALNAIKDAWALDNVPICYDGKALYVGPDVEYRIEPAAP